MSTKKLAAVTILSAAILLAAYVIAISASNKTTVTDDGPLGARFLGTLPYGGDDLLDGDGKKVGTFSNPAIERALYSSEAERLRDFLFEFPQPNQPVTFMPFGDICAAGRQIDAGSLHPYSIAAEPCRADIKMLFAGDVEKSWRYRFLFGYFRRMRRVERVDVTFRYLTGPRNDCLFTFSGPFEKGKTIVADSIANCTLNVAECLPYGNDMSLEATLEFELDAPVSLTYRMPIVAYDADGNRYLCAYHGGDLTAGRTKVSLLGVNPRIITTIAAEKPYSVTVRNCLVRYPDTSAPQYPPVVGEIARRLDITFSKASDAANYRFDDWETALKIADVARFRNLRDQVRNAIVPDVSRFRPEMLDEESRQRLHRTAVEMRGSEFTRCYGLQLGLVGGFREFIGPALEYVQEREALESVFGPGYIQDAYDAESLIRFIMPTKSLSIEQIDTISGMILGSEDGQMSRWLFNCLTIDGSAYALETLKKLASDERPWIYLTAMSCRRGLERDLLRSCEKLDDKTRLRLALAVSGEEYYDPEFQQKAYESIGDLLTWELVAMDSSRVYQLIEVMSRKVERKAAAEACVKLLESIMEGYEKEAYTGRSGGVQGMLDIIARNMNIWYGKDFAETAAVYAQYEAEHKLYRQHCQYELMRRIVRWYRENPDIEPEAIAFKGRCVDTAGNPIQSVCFQLFRDERYVDERGQVTSRGALLESAFSDANGAFAFGKVSLDPYYYLDVEGEGYMPREHLTIVQSPGGAYTFGADNAIELQRGASVSGAMYDFNGNPLPKAKVGISLMGDYSTHADHQTVETDGNGNFHFRNVSAGPHILTYVKYQDGRTADNRRRSLYGGRCAFAAIEVQEGEDVMDVVLDLSKSDSQLEICILDPDGIPVCDAQTSLDLPLGDSHYSLVLDCAKIDQRGHYSFEGLPAGEFQMWVYKEGLGGAKPTDVALRLGQKTFETIQFVRRSR